MKPTALKNTPPAPARNNCLAKVVGKIEIGVPPDEALRAYPMQVDDSGSFVPECYLEPIPSWRRLDRGPAATLLDMYARATADIFTAGSRPLCLHAAKLEASAGYQRLGYRTASDYATEELGLSGRAFRDMARLGKRLEKLPATRRAFLLRRITWTEAQVIAGIAGPEDEGQWLAKAEVSTVRELNAAARKAREQAAGSQRQETLGPEADAADIVATPDNGGTSDTAGTTDIAALPTETRQRCNLAMPEWMVGKLDAGLELAAQVAGASVPLGTRLEYIAAEFLSGTEAGVEEAAYSRTDVNNLVDARKTARDSGPPGDPRGYRRILEKESERWRFLPSVRSPVMMTGSWSALAEECVELSKEATSESGGCATTGPVEGRASERGEEYLWSLHRRLQKGLRRERTTAWELGRLLSLMRDRRLWKDLMFCSFSHYVSERLGISSRVAQRLIRLDRHGWDHPHLAVSYQQGELSVLKAEMLLRVVRLSMVDARAERAWVEYAKHVTFQRLSDAVQWAERRCAGFRIRHMVPRLMPPDDSATLRSSIDEQGMNARGPAHSAPMFVKAGDVAGIDDPTTTDSFRSPMFVKRGDVVIRDAEDHAAIGQLGLRPRSEVRVDKMPACDRALWLTEEEEGVLERALAAASVIRGPGWPRWACLNDLLDHFLHVYDSEQFRAMRRRYPLFERDGWRCRVPGCRAHEALHLHHIVFRSRGGGDEPENLVTLCDFHHLSIHRGWIRCRGHAPDKLYWELGLPMGDDGEAEHGDSRGEKAAEALDDLPRRPIARILGHRRLRHNEWWDGERIRTGGGKPSGRMGRPQKSRPEQTDYPRQLCSTLM